MKASDELKKKIAEIALDGYFHKSGTEGHLMRAAEILIEKGFTEAEAINLIQGIYCAACAEYGE